MNAQVDIYGESGAYLCRFHEHNVSMQICRNDRRQNAPFHISFLRSCLAQAVSNGDKIAEQESLVRDNWTW